MRYIIFFSLIFSNIQSDAQVLYNEIFNDEIKTVEIYKKSYRYSYPVIRLNSGERLILEFDDLNPAAGNYSYTIIHCNSDFSPSDLNPIEYIDGYEENPLDDYQSSFNTRASFNHYELEFPNADIRPLISGNYVLLIYEDYDREMPVLQRRFYVLDEKVRISGKAERSTLVSKMDDYQELSFSLTDTENIISNPHDALSVSIMQNNRSDILLENIKPDFIKGNLFEFIDPQNLSFPGGNEYRYFNVKSYRYTTDKVAHFEYIKPYYVFTLYPDKAEANVPYSYIEDLNGDFFITADNVADADIEAEYVLVDFTLRHRYLGDETNIYVFGGLSDYQVSEQNKMSYNYATQAYELRMKVKQGFYNYEYVFTDAVSNFPDCSLIEGNHSETENDYLVLVYYRPPGTYYDRLIGKQVINSVK